MCRWLALDIVMNLLYLIQMDKTIEIRPRTEQDPTPPTPYQISEGKEYMVTEVVEENQNMIKMKVVSTSKKLSSVGYAYRFMSGPSKLKASLQAQLTGYDHLPKCFAKIVRIGDMGECVHSLSRNKEKISFHVFMVEDAETVPLSLIAPMKEKKKERKIQSKLTLYFIFQKIIDQLVMFEQEMKRLTQEPVFHGNLSLETVQYFNDHIRINIPVFPTVLKMLEQSGQSCNCSQDNDIKSVVSILIALSLGPNTARQFFSFPKQKMKKVVEQISEAETDPEDEESSKLNLAYLKQKEQGLKKIKSFLNEYVDSLSSASGKFTFEKIRAFLQFEEKQSDEVNPTLIAEEPVGPMDEEDKTDIFGITLFKDYDRDWGMQDLKINKSRLFQRCFATKSHFLHFEFFTGIVLVRFRQKQKGGARLPPLALRNITISSKLCKYFRNIQHLQSFLQKSEECQFQVTDSGVLSCFVPEKVATKLSSQNCYPDEAEKNSIIIKIEGERKVGFGLAINPRVVMTSADYVYDRNNKIQTTSNMTVEYNQKSVKCLRFHYNPEYETCSEQEIWKQNIAFLFLQAPITAVDTSIPLVLNFDQSSDKYATDSLDHPSFFVSGSKIVNLNIKQQAGSPIYRTQEQDCVIGLKTAEGAGLLFNEEFLIKCYRSMVRLGVNRELIHMTPFIPFKMINFESKRQSSVLPNIDALLDEDQVKEGRITREFLERWCANLSQIRYLLEKTVIAPQLCSQTKIKFYSVIIQICKRVYGNNVWRLPYYCLESALTYKRVLNDKKASQILQNAQKRELQGRNSPFLLAEINFTLGQLAQYSENFNQAQQRYEKALGLLEKIQGRQLQQKIYHNLGLLSQAKGDTEKSILYFNKSLTVSQASSQSVVETLKYCLTEGANEDVLVGVLSKFDKWEQVLVNQPQLKKYFDALSSQYQIKGKNNKDNLKYNLQQVSSS